MTRSGPNPRDHYASNRLDRSIRQQSPEWLNEYDRRRLVVFTHVPKAGGTGLKQALTRAYGRHFVDHHPTMSDVIGQVQRSERDPGEILAMSSHLAFGVHRRIDAFAERLVLPFTVVRDPMDRMISYFNFVTSFPPHRFHNEMKDLAINDFFRLLLDRGVGEVSNSQSHLISGTDRTAASAIAALASDYFGHAPLDQHSELEDLLQRALGWPEIPSARSGPANTSPKRAGLDDLSDEVRAQLQAANAEDIRLYEWVRQQGAVVRPEMLGS